MIQLIRLIEVLLAYWSLIANASLFKYFKATQNPVQTILNVCLKPRTLICHRLLQNKAKLAELNVLNFGWPPHKGNWKDNRKLSSGRPKGGRGRLKEVAG